MLMSTLRPNSGPKGGPTILKLRVQPADSSIGVAARKNGCQTALPFFGLTGQFSSDRAMVNRATLPFAQALGPVISHIRLHKA
ncbi:hypothetical protein [Sinorhizobium fredii]|uniref:Uncharacterized protein n=1 Tax=Rhizobium fredii TaxID=380 RepID=A0A2L0HBF7_RHIFR|nr:hypothetical protein [Sinorhizobium fredii]AUX78838.1 hypothetical protein NXT3_PB00177 [Sinorhizobium fredii]